MPPGPVILTHCDRPLVRMSTLSRLAAVSDDAVWVPHHRGRPGHPVRLPGYLRNRLLAPDDVPLRALLGVTRALHVDDPGVLVNVNTPDALARLRGFEGPLESSQEGS